MTSNTLRQPATALFPPEEHNANGAFRLLLSWIRSNGNLLLVALCVLLILAAFMFAGSITHHNPTASMDLRSRFLPPVWEAGGSMEHPLGTDHLGRDVLSRTLHGGRISLQIALIASTIAVLGGATYGLISGYAGGWVDRILSAITDVWVAFPFLVLALAVIAAVGASISILIILLSMAGWVYPARVTRAQTLKIRHQEFVQASVATGASHLHIIRYHILPNLVSINVVLWTLCVGTAILIEGSLSFLGLGISPPTPSWGTMLNEGRTYLQDAWWLSVFPGLTLMITVLLINASGDALQNLLSHGESVA
jgi:ABC-type dipeptide/oligopeptide/nickel transport system permease subunit